MYHGKYTSKSTRKPVFPTLLAVVSLLLIAVSLYNILTTMQMYSRQEHTEQELSGFFSGIPSAGSAPASQVVIPESGEVSVDIFADLSFPEVDFPALKEVNSEIIGWIWIEDTTVNYPICQSGDNAFYLNHMYNQVGNGSGSIYMDYRCNPSLSDRNTILYGHNMKNNTMFHDLVNYQDQAFADTHPVFRLMTPEGNYAVLVFSAYPASVYENSWQLEFTEETFAQWLDDCSSRSLIQTDVMPTARDKILTLSTCSSAFHNARLLVHGIVYKVD